MVLSTDTWLYLTAAGSSAFAVGGVGAPKAMHSLIYEKGTPELLPPLRYFGVASAGIAAHALALAHDKDVTEESKKKYLKVEAGLWLAAGATTAIHTFRKEHKKDIGYAMALPTLGVGALMMFDACRNKKGGSCCGCK